MPRRNDRIHGKCMAGPITLCFLKTGLEFEYILT
jgi:hypothetical protein